MRPLASEFIVSDACAELLFELRDVSAERTWSCREAHVYQLVCRPKSLGNAVEVVEKVTDIVTCDDALFAEFEQGHSGANDDLQRVSSVSAGGEGGEERRANIASLHHDAVPHSQQCLDRQTARKHAQEPSKGDCRELDAQVF